MNIDDLRQVLPEQALCSLPELPWNRVASGKVREIYDLGDYLLLLTTDRLSAFDVILPDGIPGKGIILNQLSLFWFSQTQDIIPNHLAANHTERLAELLRDFPELQPRAMLVHKLRPLSIEAIVRGYVAGSAWKSFRVDATIFGQTAPDDLVESARLPQPLFTPTTKARVGEHDEALSLEAAEKRLGSQRFAQVRDAALAIFERGQTAAAKAGLILADTKFEFGLDDAGELYLIDEVLTPDSSRYWKQADYVPGKAQPAFDKQYVRDYLETLDWNKKSPGPRLPESVITRTRDLYLQVSEELLSAH